MFQCLEVFRNVFNVEKGGYNKTFIVVNDKRYSLK